MKQTPRCKVLVAGLGNPDRGDDGVGPLVARILANYLPPEVTTLSVGNDVLTLVAEWACFDLALCIDAAAPLSGPGRIHRFDLTTTDLPRWGSSTSSHGLGLADAVALARSLHQAPSQIIVYAIEGASFAAGASMTPDVVAAVEEVVVLIAAEVERWRQTAKEIGAHA